MHETLTALAEYGIGIFSVGTSLAIIWLLFNKLIKHTERQNESFTGTVKDLADRHERERATWSEVEGRRASQTDKVLSELRDVIRDSIKNKENQNG